MQSMVTEKEFAMAAPINPTSGISIIFSTKLIKTNKTTRSILVFVLPRAIKVSPNGPELTLINTPVVSNIIGDDAS